MEFALYRTAL